jgi:hypothetical protein
MLCNRTCDQRRGNECKNRQYPDNCPLREGRIYKNLDHAVLHGDDLFLYCSELSQDSLDDYTNRADAILAEDKDGFPRC